MYHMSIIAYLQTELKVCCTRVQSSNISNCICTRTYVVHRTRPVSMLAALLRQAADGSTSGKEHVARSPYGRQNPMIFLPK